MLVTILLDSRLKAHMVLLAILTFSLQSLQLLLSASRAILVQKNVLTLVVGATLVLKPAVLALIHIQQDRMQDNKYVGLVTKGI